MRFRIASDRALLVETADLDEAIALTAAWAEVDGVVELVPGARTVLVRFDPLIVSADDLAEALRAVPLGTTGAAHAGEVVIPVVYDGDDLADAAELLGVSVEELVRRHQQASWRVGFVGFAPGFGYLVGTDPIFDVPRRATPRVRVPAGAVALAGEFTGVYPRESPGGWQLIGRTDAVMWNVERDPPALLRPGARVRFVDANAAAISRVAARTLPVAAPSHPVPEPTSPFPEPTSPFPEPMSPFPEPTSPVPEPVEGRGVLAHAGAVEVISAGLQLLVQDRGRPGLAHLGVSASGAADRIALRDANRAVGNATDAAALELIGAAALRFRGPGVVAVAGAAADTMVTAADGEIREPGRGAPFAVADGDVLELGFPARGLRQVIAVRGGIVVPPVLGSRSTDTLAGIGPTPLSAGDVVPVGGAVASAVDPLVVPRELPGADDIVELDIVLGPRDDWFTASAIRTLTTQEWAVTPRSDRIGIRLHGEVPLERTSTAELPSEGVVTGAIQVPADGQPVLFLADHPLTGGYPVIGAVTGQSLDLAAQLPPGARVRFRVR